jgi:hypothetical protein
MLWRKSRGKVCRDIIGSPAAPRHQIIERVCLYRHAGSQRICSPRSNDYNHFNPNTIRYGSGKIVAETDKVLYGKESKESIHWL